jgi:hypothetical protein
MRWSEENSENEDKTTSQREKAWAATLAARYLVRRNEHEPYIITPRRKRIALGRSSCWHIPIILEGDYELERQVAGTILVSRWNGRASCLWTSDAGIEASFLDYPIRLSLSLCHLVFQFWDIPVVDISPFPISLS